MTKGENVERRLTVSKNRQKIEVQAPRKNKGGRGYVENTPELKNTSQLQRPSDAS
jgi:hypothetical protein